MFCVGRVPVDLSPDCCSIINPIAGRVYRHVDEEHGYSNDDFRNSGNRQYDDRDKPADDHSEEQTNKDANETHVHGERPFHDGEDVNDGARIHCPGHESNLIQVRKG